MAHYAYIDHDWIVTDVITGTDESNFDWEQFYANQRGMLCKRTSLRTYGGQHPEGKPFRKNYAGIGHTYDPVRDAFIPPKPDGDWTLDEDTCLWVENTA
jgi:hypothetical protein